MTAFRLKAACSLVMGATLFFPAVTSAQINESFESFAALAADGWVFIDRSTPLGTPGWFQGLPFANSFFDANSGPANAYVASGFGSVDDGDPTATTFTLSNWMLTPEVDLVNGSEFSFFTRTIVPNAVFADRLQLWLSISGPSVDVGNDAESEGDFNFSGLPLFEINEAQTSSGYPAVWTNVTITLSGLPESARGRFGFRHYVTDVQNNGDYIGIDDVTYLVAPMQVPEPSGLMLLLGGTLGVVAVARRGRRTG